MYSQTDVNLETKFQDVKTTDFYVCFQYHNARQSILQSVVTSTVFRMFDGSYLIYTAVCRFFNLVNISYRQALIGSSLCFTCCL